MIHTIVRRRGSEPRGLTAWSRLSYRSSTPAAGSAWRDLIPHLIARVYGEAARDAVARLIEYRRACAADQAEMTTRI
jgi:hypothetical protein